MKKKQKLFLGFVIIVMTIFSVASCDLFPTTEFPSEFRGTWVRDNGQYPNNTRTITADTFKQSEQSGIWNLENVSGDTYTLSYSTDSSHKAVKTIILVNDKLQISGCGGSGESNCNGTWRKR